MSKIYLLDKEIGDLFYSNFSRSTSETWTRWLAASAAGRAVPPTQQECGGCGRGRRASSAAIGSPGGHADAAQGRTVLLAR
jgi:hypothetical protein